MRNISDTAYLVAMYRALATEHPKAMFQDPFARLLAGGRGEFLSEIFGDKQQAIKVMNIRTCAIDDMIQRLIISEQVDTVINLGAGLDTRPYRLPLPTKLRWIEVDFPAILTYKEQKLQDEQPVCFLERSKIDITDTISRKDLLAQINASSSRVLVLAEGLLSYLSEIQVAALAADMERYSNLRWWLFELMSPIMLQNFKHDRTQKLFDQYFANGDTTFLFAPIAGTEFFKPYGWQVKELRSVWPELKSWNQWLWLLEILIRLFSKQQWRMLQESGFVLLEQVTLD
jgi:methyltransferase (TIGR00027 family)